MKIKTFKPLWDKLLTTADRYESSIGDDGLVEDGKTEGYIKEYQTVVEVSSACPSDIKVGEVVIINSANYSRPRHTSNKNSVTEKDREEVEMVVSYPVVEVDGKERLLITYRDLEAVITVDESAEILE